jgi:hypothetical protein
MRGLKDAIPFKVTKLELMALPKAPKSMFERSIKTKISEGLSNEVIEFVRTSNVFKGMKPEQLSKILGVAFIMKINDSRYKDANKSLSEFLVKNNLKEDYLRFLVERISLEELRKL